VRFSNLGANMSRQVIIYDNFYKDPKYIRSIAEDNPNTQLMCSDLNNLLVSLIGAYTAGSNNKNNGCFKLDLDRDRVETIDFNLEDKWTGIVFLTPNEYNTEENGVTFWKNKETNKYAGDLDDISNTLTTESIINGYAKKDKLKQSVLNSEQWGQDIFIPGKFNRAIFFKSNLFNTVSSGFGEDFKNGKLIQSFYFGDNNESN